MTSEKQNGRVREFVVRKIFSSWGAKAQRYCLSPLFPVGSKGALAEDVDEDEVPHDGPAGKIAHAILNIQKQWRVRLMDLRAEGWLRFSTPKDFNYAMNCPPVSVLTNQLQLTCCREYRVCPFCWARSYARDLYLAAEYAVYGNNRTVWLAEAMHGDVKEQFRFTDIITVVDSFWYPMANWKVADVLDDMKKDYRRTAMQTTKFGAYTLSTLEPTKMVTQDTWAWKRMDRTLFLTNPGWESPAQERTHDQVSVTRQMQRVFMASRENIAAAVGRVCIYPAGMLHDAPKQAVDLLQACTASRQYFSAYYGVLRNRSLRRQNYTQLQSPMEAELRKIKEGT